MNNHIKGIKITLAIILLLCLLDMPYGFYQLVRFVSMLGFSLLAFHSYKQGHKVWLIVSIILALLFQPFEKVALGRTLWNIVDVVVGIGLLLSLWIKPKEKP